MKSIIIASFIVAICVQASAQKISVGIKAGVSDNSFTLKAKDESDAKISLQKAGFHAGALVDFRFSKCFSLQPQLLIASKGGKLKQGIATSEFNFLTLDLPVNFLYNQDRFFIGGGPQFSYGLRARGKDATDTEFDLYNESDNIQGSFRRFEMGANGTIGYRFPCRLIVAANFCLGLSDLFKEGEDVDVSIDARNRSWSFSLAYSFF